jgi:hypothetical protein
MVKVMAIAEILADSPSDPDANTSDERIDWYRSRLDDVPPVVVFDTEAGLLLVDGYHRVAAALREGSSEIRADLRTGSRSDALAYAVANGVRQRGLSAEDVRARIVKPQQNEE